MRTEDITSENSGMIFSKDSSECGKDNFPQLPNSSECTTVDEDIQRLTTAHTRLQTATTKKKSQQSQQSLMRNTGPILMEALRANGSSPVQSRTQIPKQHFSFKVARHQRLYSIRKQYPISPLGGSNSLPFLTWLPAVFVSSLKCNSLLPCLSQVNTMRFGEDYCKSLSLKGIGPFLRQATGFCKRHAIILV